MHFFCTMEYAGDIVKCLAARISEPIARWNYLHGIFQSLGRHSDVREHHFLKGNDCRIVCMQQHMKMLAKKN